MPDPADIASQLTLPAERPPFASFPARLGAFVADCIVLALAGYLLNKTIRPYVLLLNPWLPYIGHIAAFAYFFIGNGPLTGGRTLGKSILNIQVTGSDGQPIGWGAAFRRAFLQQFAFLFVVHEGTLIFSQSSQVVIGLVLMMPKVISLTWLILLSVSILFHPRRRGLHDLWGSSFCIPTPPPKAFHAAMSTPMEPLLLKRTNLYLALVVLFWAAASIVIAIMGLITLNKPETRRHFAEYKEILSSAHFEKDIIASINIPRQNLERREVFDLLKAIARQKRLNSEDGADTETLKILNNLQAPIAIQLKRVHGAYRPADIMDPNFRQNMEKLRALLWQKWKTQPVPDDVTTVTVRLEGFRAELFEPYQFFLYNDSVPRAKVAGAADPAAGELIYEDLAAARPGEADRPTTATTVPGPVLDVNETNIR